MLVVTSLSPSLSPFPMTETVSTAARTGAIHFNREWTRMDANKDVAGGSPLHLRTDSRVGDPLAQPSTMIFSIDSREFASIRGSTSESFRRWMAAVSVGLTGGNSNTPDQPE